MSEPPPMPPADPEFDAALRARRPLLPRFDGPLQDQEPPPELDRLVLDRAREALRREAPPARLYRGPRWAAPVAIAATLLLSFALVMQMQLKGDATLSGSHRSSEADATVSDSNVAAAVEQATPPPLAATRAPDATPQTASARAARPAPAPASVSTPQRGLAAVPAPPAEATRADANDATRAVAKFAAPRAAALAAPVAPESMPAADTAAASEPAADPNDDPDRWLAEIERLRAADDLDTARRELAAFRKRFPDRPLPAALKALR